TLDTERMALMSARFMTVLPHALAYRNSAMPGRSARFVLTGPAGGCYDVSLDAQTSLAPGTQPDVTIVTDVIDLCRVAARRLSVDSLSTVIDGDPALAAAVLAAADAFARD